MTITDHIWFLRISIITLIWWVMRIQLAKGTKCQVPRDQGGWHSPSCRDRGPVHFSWISAGPAHQAHFKIWCHHCNLQSLRIDQVTLERLRSYASYDDSSTAEEFLSIIAGSICKNFSSMGDGSRLIGKHVLGPHSSYRYSHIITPPSHQLTNCEQFFCSFCFVSLYWCWERPQR